MTQSCTVCQNFAPMRCPHCPTKIWYCGSKYQEHHLVEHIFDCRKKHAITTAHYIALAVQNNMLPFDSQARVHYGFSRALNYNQQAALLDLFVEVMQVRGIKAEILYTWLVNGTLVQEIKTCLERPPVDQRSYTYHWLLENEWILTGTYDQSKARDVKEMTMKGWLYAGKSILARTIDMQLAFEQWTESKFACWTFCTMILSDLHPAPTDRNWTTFGFCVCDSKESEDTLQALYQQLLKSCPFQHFVTAYESSKMVDLFQSKGLGSQLAAFSFLEGVLVMSPYISLSVWNLKQFATITMVLNRTIPLIPSVYAHYGFMNCEIKQEADDLTAAYRSYFSHKDANPLHLHEACTEGRLFSHVSKCVKLNNKKKYKRLMKNTYPLPYPLPPFIAVYSQGPAVYDLGPGDRVLGSKNIFKTFFFFTSLCVVLIASILYSRCTFC